MLLPSSALPKVDPIHPTVPPAPVAAYKRLWVHETLRVFYDRLVDSQDRNWLLGQLQGVVTQHLGMDMDQLMGHLLQPGEAEVGQEQLRRWVIRLLLGVCACRVGLLGVYWVS